MKYQDTLDFLYNQLPMFQRIGGAAYKSGLETSIQIDELYNHPHQSYKTIHVAGTNGKGSVSHTLASILQEQGYRVGLYTSPHLVDFRERIRVNGEMIPREDVSDFVGSFLQSGYKGSPSFFELTMMMAFDYFRKQHVDYAVIEVGLGGRLDSTNIITPILSIITNISFDHTQFLGNTLAAIASEKAGIIKTDIPCVIGEAKGDVRDVFAKKAEQVHAPITFAEESPLIKTYKFQDQLLHFTTTHDEQLTGELAGECQIKNANTILHAIVQLRSLGITISPSSVSNGFRHVCRISGLLGRWMLISTSPLTICDTGHNVGGISYISHQLAHEKYRRLHIVIGFVKDKDISHILDMLPADATYYFTNAAIPRALPCKELLNIAISKGLKGTHHESVPLAYQAALSAAAPDDMIFIGGSTFIVADFLASLQQ